MIMSYLSEPRNNEILLISGLLYFWIFEIQYLGQCGRAWRYLLVMRTLSISAFTMCCRALKLCTHRGHNDSFALAANSAVTSKVCVVVGEGSDGGMEVTFLSEHGTV
jgi:hypothetical protein